MAANQLAPQSLNALDMSPYEAQFNVQDTNYKNRRYATDVYSALVPALMRAQFPEYVAFSPATVTANTPKDPRNYGAFSPWKRTIDLNPSGTNSMLMDPYGKYGYVGVGTNTTTDDTLNALRTMLHESMHARMNLAPNQRLAREHPAAQLKKQMPSDKYYEMLRDISSSKLPSVGAETSPYGIIDEYFSTATPVRQMKEKNMATFQTLNELKEVNRLAEKYPELETMRRNWERPELFAKDK